MTRTAATIDRTDLVLSPAGELVLQVTLTVNGRERSYVSDPRLLTAAAATTQLLRALDASALSQVRGRQVIAVIDETGKVTELDSPGA